MDEIILGDRAIGLDHPPFIIAEMSGNHNQSLERALGIIDAAAEAGVDAIKIQTYTPDTMTLPLKRSEFRVTSENSLWKGELLYNLYKKAHTPWEWHSVIFERCKQKGLLAFSTPFDETAVDFLESLGVPAYKIASFENTDIPLIRKVAATGKPVIISTGMSTLAEIDEMIRAAKVAGCRDIVLLKCTSSYPGSPEDSNIATIPHMRSVFGLEVGLSDHTMGIGVALASVSLGATVIEKHFTLSRADGGVDSAFSLEPKEMKRLVTESKRAWNAIGTVFFGPTPSERESLKYRRSLYVTKDVKKGERLTNANVKSLRPAYGLPSKYLDIVLGRAVSRNVRKGTPLTWDLLL